MEFMSWNICWMFYAWFIGPTFHQIDTFSSHSKVNERGLKSLVSTGWIIALDMQTVLLCVVFFCLLFRPDSTSPHFLPFLLLSLLWSSQLEAAAEWVHCNSNAREQQKISSHQVRKNERGWPFSRYAAAQKASAFSQFHLVQKTYNKWNELRVNHFTTFNTLISHSRLNAYN